MRRRTFEEMITYFNQTVSEMDIDRKYKMTLLGIVTALLQKHDEELAKNSPKVNSDSGELISRQSAIETLNVGAELLRRVLDDADIVGAERAKYEWGLGLIESYISDMKEIPSAQPEMIREIRKWINSGNRGNADYFIVEKIEEIINKYE